jgi:hypothetical protein
MTDSQHNTWRWRKLLSAGFLKGSVFAIFSLFGTSLTFSDGLSPKTPPLPGLAQIREVFGNYVGIRIAGNLGSWQQLTKDRYSYIEFESLSEQVRAGIQKWLRPKRWKRIQADEFQTFAAGTVLAIDLFQNDGKTRDRLVLISGQLKVGNEIWEAQDEPGSDPVGLELASLLALPENRKTVVDMSIAEAEKCIRSRKKPSHDLRFKGVDNDPKWRRAQNPKE